MTQNANITAPLSRRTFLRNATLGLGSCALTSMLSTEGQSQSIGSNLNLSLDPLLQPLRAQYDVPALGAAVLINNLILVGAVGYRRYDLPAISVTHDDQFHIGSCTKAMTATIIGMMIQQGLGNLTWTTKIGDIFPEFKAQMNPEYQQITVDHLLAHASGFSSNTMPADPGAQIIFNINTLQYSRWYYTGSILTEWPAVPVGNFNYSNRNYVVLGAIIERILHTSWENAITQLLFKPLGMSSAGFGPMGGLAVDQPWQHALQGGVHIQISPIPWSDNPELIGPAGTVHCSVLHWMRFVQEHYLGLKGQSKLMNMNTYQRLHAPQFAGSTYAGGWGRVDLPWSNNVYNHAGSNGINYAIVMMSTSRNFAVVVTTNQGGPQAQSACDNTGGALVSWAQSNGLI